MTEEQYQTWLASNEPRCFLAEIEYYDSGLKTLYFSTHGYVSYPTDSPANMPYTDAILSIPQFDTALSLSLDNFSVQATAQRGDLIIANPNGEYDNWLDFGFDGRRINIYIGGINWLRADFRLLINGFIESVESRGNTWVLKLRGIEHLLDVEISTTLIASGNDKDKPLPLTFGDCFNIQPVLIDAALHKYQVNQGSIISIIVKDNGVVVTATPDLVNGTFTLAAQPAGTITCDVVTSLTKVSDIVKHILLNRTLLVEADLDLVSFSSHLALCPQTVGLYVRAGGKVITLINELLTSVGSFITRNPNGKIRIARFGLPSNTPILEITSDNIYQGKFTIKQSYPAIYRLKLGYKRNYAPSDSVAGSINEATRERLKAEYIYVSATDLSVQTIHPLANSPPDYFTNLVIESEGLAEAQRLLSIFSVPRRIYEIEATLDASRLQIGDTVKVFHHRYGFDNGLNVVVLSLSIKPNKQAITLEVFR